MEKIAEVKNYNTEDMVELDFTLTPAERIKYLAKERNVTLKEMAEYLQVTQMVVLGWLSKRQLPPLRYINGIADFLEVDVRYLITGKKECCYTDIPEEHKEMLKEFQELSSVRQEEIKSYIKLLLREERMDKQC